MTTDPELVPVAQLRELLAKATPGNWCVVTGKNISVGPCPGQRVALCNYDNGPIEKANAALIAKMHNALPALLDELDALRALRAQVEGLQAFAQDVMECWPEGAPDGGDLQEFATKHGLLREVVMPGPCGEDCGCTEFISSDEWPSTCYRKTSLLTGRPESDASIDRLLAAPAGGEG